MSGHEGAESGDDSAEKRADRRWGEMLQEVRVSQTGAQVLFGFLLSVAFAPRFAALHAFDKNLYVVTVALGATATGTLISTVPFHRFLAQRDLKPELVRVGGWLISLGMALLALTVGSALLLLLRVATGDDALAVAVTGGVMGWIAVCWLIVPAVMRRRGEQRDGRR